MTSSRLSRVESPRSIRMSPEFVILSLYLLIAVVFYVFVGRHAISGAGDSLQFYADSLTYIELAETMENSNWTELVAVSYNHLGPVLILLTVNFNHTVVFILNALLILVSYAVICRYFEVRRTLFAIALVASPMLFSSLILINKEIFAIASIAMFLAFVRSRKLTYLLLALLVSLLARWQLTFFEVVAFAIMRLEFLKIARPLALVALVLCLTGLSSFFSNELALVEEKSRLGIEAYEGSGLFTALLDLQQEYGYALVAIPKLLHLAFGMVLRFDRLLDFSDFYNNVIIFSQVAAFACLTVYLVTKRRAKLQFDLFYLGIIYMLIFSVSPIYAPRYFFPVYFIFALLAAARTPVAASCDARAWKREVRTRR